MRIDGPQITGSFSIGNTTFPDINALATTGSNTFIGNQVISGSIVSTQTTLISGSSQVLGGTGIFSSSAQLPSGIISGSSQLPTGIVSSSAQVTAYGVSTTGSNIFQGNQTITGSLFISENLVVAGSSSIQHISSSVVNINDNIITVNVLNPSVRFGGLAVIDSGSSPQVSGSILFDSINNQWLFVHQNQGTVTSSVLLMGPETYNNLGNEGYITENRLVKSTGIEHLADSNITDTGTKVSINSNTEVTGSLIGTSTAVFGGSVTTTNAILSATGYLGFGGGTNYIEGDNNNNIVRIGTNNVPRLTISSTGRVGLGETSPVSSLVVSTQSDTNSIGQSGIVIQGSSTLTQGNIMALSFTAIPGTTRARAAVGSIVGSDWGKGNLTFYTRDASDSSTLTTADERMRITSGGNVGIGTASPFANLQVLGTIKVATGNAQGILGLGEANGTTVNVGLWRGAANAPTTDGNFLNLGGFDGIVFATGNAAIGSQTPRMRITSDGNVGIGTPGPVARLDTISAETGTYGTSTQQVVARFYNLPSSLGSGNNSAFLSLQTSADGGNANPVARIGVVGESYGSNNGAFVVATRDGSGVTERMRITSGGNVGIGTSSPLAFGGLTTLSINGNVGALGLMNNGSNVFLLYNDGSNTLLNSVSNTGLVFGANNTERMRITSGGNVLIGTTTDIAGRLQVSAPSALVTVTSTTIETFNGLEFKNGGGSFYIGQDSSTGNFYGSNTAYAGCLYTSGPRPIVFLPGTVERMRITSGGNVGIGTASPDANSRLDVNGQTFVAHLAIYNNNGTPSLGTSPMLYSPASGTIAISTNVAERMRITSSGNVLIGTTTDNGARLQVNGGDFTVRKNSSLTNPEADLGFYSTFINTNSTVGSGAGIALGSNNNAGATIYSQLVNNSTNEHILGFQVRNSSNSSTTRMVITGGGKVGVANTNPNNVVDIYDQTHNNNTVGLLGVRTRGGGTFITGRSVPAETSNQTLTIATCSASGGNERIFIKVQVVNVSAVQNSGNVHIGYALWSSSGGSTVTTMTLDNGNSNVSNTNVGSLSWSGNNLQYTTNRNSNYELNSITIWGSARDTGVIT